MSHSGFIQIVSNSLTFIHGQNQQKCSSFLYVVLVFIILLIIQQLSIVFYLILSLSQQIYMIKQRDINYTSGEFQQNDITKNTPIQIYRKFHFQKLKIFR